MREAEKACNLEIARLSKAGPIRPGLYFLTCWTNKDVKDTDADPPYFVLRKEKQKGLPGDLEITDLGYLLETPTIGLWQSRSAEE